MSTEFPPLAHPRFLALVGIQGGGIRIIRLGGFLPLDWTLPLFPFFPPPPVSFFGILGVVKNYENVKIPPVVMPTQKSSERRAW